MGMRIDFELLRSKGWEVHVEKDGVLIQGQEPFRSIGQVISELEEKGLGRVEAEVLADEFFMKIEGRLILAALE